MCVYTFIDQLVRLEEKMKRKRKGVNDKQISWFLAFYLRVGDFVIFCCCLLLLIPHVVDKGVN